MKNKCRLAAFSFIPSIYPCPVFLLIPPPLNHLSLSNKHYTHIQTHTQTHTSLLFFSSSLHVSAIAHSRQAKNTCFSLVCCTRKLLVVIQQPNNHRSVWLLTCVWAEHTHTHPHTNPATLFSSIAHTGKSRAQSFSCSH